MSRKCDDSNCPANKIQLGSKKSRKIRPKEKSSKVQSSDVSRRNFKADAKRKKDSTESSLTAKHTRACKNKKCQASKATVECSTSTHPTCPRKKSTKPGTSYGLCSGKKGECCCGSNDSFKRTKPSISPVRSREKRRKRKKSHCASKKGTKRKNDRPRDYFTALCICVRRPRVEKVKLCKCDPSCTILEKHGKCCCTKREKKKKESKEKGGKRNAGGKIEFDRRYTTTKCLCEPLKSETPEESRGILARILNSVRDGLEKLLKTDEPDRCKPCAKARKLPRCPASCSTQSNCLEMPLQKRCRHVSAEKKVKPAE